MFVKTLLKLCKVFLITSILLLVGVHPITAEQDELSLYSYFMYTYNKDYIDTSFAKEKLKELQKEYHIIKQNNLQAESFEILKAYAPQVEKEINLKIDLRVEEIQLKQVEVVSKIEERVSYATPRELSILNREYSKLQENIEEALSNKTSIMYLFENPTYDRIDSSSIELSIQEQEKLLSYDANNDNTNLGDLKELKTPFEYTRKVSSRAGYRTDPFTGVVTFHGGTDYAIPSGTPLYSLFNGTVVASDDSGGKGYGDKIKIDCGNGIVLLYAHLSERRVKVGDQVSQNQFIGYSGNTGRSTGPHLHLSLYYKGEVLDVERLFQ